MSDEKHRAILLLCLWKLRLEDEEKVETLIWIMRGGEAERTASKALVAIAFIEKTLPRLLNIVDRRRRRIKLK